MARVARRAVLTLPAVNEDTFWNWVAAVLLGLSFVAFGFAGWIGSFTYLHSLFE